MPNHFSLGLKQISQIWIPELIFSNSLDQTAMSIDSSSTLTVQ